ncbi:MAG: AAA family ATPase, partial [Actinomycetota bacterium]
MRRKDRDPDSPGQGSRGPRMEAFGRHGSNKRAAPAAALAPGDGNRNRAIVAMDSLPPERVGDTNRPYLLTDGAEPETMASPAPDAPAVPGSPESSERSEGDEAEPIFSAAPDSEDSAGADGPRPVVTAGEAHPPRVLVLDRHGSFSARLGAAIAGLDPAPEVLRLNRPTQVVEVVEQQSPAVIVIAPAEVTGAGLRRLAEVHRAHPRIVIILSDNGKPLSLRHTALCGAGDVLPSRPSKARFRAKIARALDIARDLRAEHPVITERVIIREAPAPRLAPAPRRDLARVFTVASASGGCGKTFLSTNLAAYLTRATGARVLLVDFDLQFGEVAISLHLRPSHTIDELVEVEDIVSSLGDFVVDH